MQRRSLLQAAAALPLAGMHSTLWAVPAAPEVRLLLVFLRGGYDATNVLVPLRSADYLEARPTLAIARPDVNNPQAALELETPWGLHPALRDSVLPLWERGELAFIPFAGTHDLSRSHFETQDSMEAGQPLDAAHKDYGSGFLNRLAQQLGTRAHAVSFTEGLPVIFKGALTVPNVSLKRVNRTGLQDSQAEKLLAMYRGTRLESALAEGLELRKEVARDDGPLSAEMQAANRNAVGPRGFELEARRTAHLMRSRFNLGFIDIGGWDTHANQGGAQGALANGLSNLGAGLAAFAQEMGNQWQHTVVVVLSEFGRTFRENGSRGTDHGHGSVYWVLGGSVKGQRIVGEQIEVQRSALHQDRDLPVLNEYRAVLGGLMQRMYGLSHAQLATVFAQSKAADLGLV